jgi:hypothetical protein
MTRVQGTRSRLVEAAATPLSETSPLTGVAVVELPTTRRLRSETAVTVDPVVVDLAKQITEVRAAQQREPRIRNSEVTVHQGSSLLLQLAQLVAAVVVRAVLVLLRGLVAQERPAALLGVPWPMQAVAVVGAATQARTTVVWVDLVVAAVAAMTTPSRQMEQTVEVLAVAAAEETTIRETLLERVTVVTELSSCATARCRLRQRSRR